MFLIKKNKQSEDMSDAIELVDKQSNEIHHSKSPESKIDEGLLFIGNINGSGPLNIKGYFEGVADISGDIVIGSGAVLKADLKAKNIVIAGKMDGHIYATECVKILNTGYVKGSITAKTFSIETGAKFMGNSIVIEEDLRQIEHSEQTAE